MAARGLDVPNASAVIDYNPTLNSSPSPSPSPYPNPNPNPIPVPKPKPKPKPQTPLRASRDQRTRALEPKPDAKPQP